MEIVAGFQRDNTILSAVVKSDDLKQQLLADQLKKLPKALCTNDQLSKTPVSFFTCSFTRCLDLAFHHRLDSTLLTYQLLYESS